MNLANIPIGVGLAGLVLFGILVLWNRQRGRGTLSPMIVLAAVLMVVGLVGSSIVGGQTSFVIGASAIFFVFSVFVFFLERRGGAGAVFGPAGLVVTMCIVIGMLSTPYIQTIVAQLQAGSVGQAQSAAEVVAAGSAYADLPVSGSAASLPTLVSSAHVPPTNTRTPIPPTMTPTPFTYSLPTALPPICNGTVLENVNFRAEPSLSGERITGIAKDTMINVFGRDDSGDWLQVVYEDDQTHGPRNGWVFASIVDLETDCSL